MRQDTRQSVQTAYTEACQKASDDARYDTALTSNVLHQFRLRQRTREDEMQALVDRDHARARVLGWLAVAVALGAYALSFL